MLIEDNNIISEESVVSNTMKQHFTNITKKLKVKQSLQLNNLKDIIYYHHNHISIEKNSPKTKHIPNYLLLI